MNVTSSTHPIQKKNTNIINCFYYKEIKKNNTKIEYATNFQNKNNH